MKIVLYCESGMSTSLLVSKMRVSASDNDIIDAFSISDVDTTMDKYDVVLLGPQVRIHYNSLKQMADKIGIPCLVMDMISYGRMDGKAIYLQAKEAYESK